MLFGRNLRLVAVAPDLFELKVEEGSGGGYGVLVGHVKVKVEVKVESAIS